MRNPIIGIDLGTTNSVLSILVDKEPQTILIDHNKLLPSVISVTAQGVVVGQTAKNMAVLEPDNTVVSIKRKMGEDVVLNVGELQLRPEEVSAMILKKIRNAAITYLQLEEQHPIRCVITVPAYFTEEQRLATKRAAELANLQIERIINEPTAAALAFGMASLDEAIYAIYDFGGGTFDVSVIESNAGLVEVLSTTGDNKLGGDDLDHWLMDYIWTQFKEANKLRDADYSRKEKARLWHIAEQTKIKLSSEQEVHIQESFFYKKGDINYHLDLIVYRSDFEKIIQSAVDKTIVLLQEAIQDARLKNDEVDGVILVGGSSRIPMIASLVEQRTGISAALIDLPDEAVSHGATIQGAIIDKLDVNTVLVDITPHSLGTAVLDEEMAIFRKFDVKKEKDYLLTSVLIQKNTPIPVKRKKSFSAVVPFQRAYEIQVSQGEAEHYIDNTEIGNFLLELEKPVQYGRIEVNFELDINGLLTVTAEETSTKEKISAVIQSPKGMKMKKSKLKSISDMGLVSDEETNPVLKKAEDLLAKNQLPQEDAADLKALIAQFKSQHSANDFEAMKTTEIELLDLLYFLEKK